MSYKHILKLKLYNIGKVVNTIKPVVAIIVINIRQSWDPKDWCGVCVGVDVF